MKSLRSSVTNRILAMKFASEFILIYPLMTIMFADRGGVGAEGIGFLLALSMILSVIFEIPTGIIADKIPRKYVLATSLFFKLLCFFAYLIFPSFSGFVLASVLFAVSSALESGALQAYLYGTLGKDNKQGFGKFWARVSAMVMISYTTAYILTTIIGVNYPLLIILSIVPILIALMICLSLPLDSIERSKESVRPKVFASAIHHIATNKELIKLLLSGVIIVAATAVLIDFISLYYKQIGIETRWVPIMLAIGNIIGAWLFWTLHSWEPILEKYRIIIVAFATGLFLVSLKGNLVVLSVSILLFTRLFRVLQVQYDSKLQHLANDEARATISSIGSFVSLILGGILSIIIGQFAVNESIVGPLQVTLIATATAYVTIHGFIRYKRNTNINS
jgi:MFS family permease